MQTEMMMQINAENPNFQVTVALDALFEGRTVADLLIGLPATVGLGCDRYAAKITKVTTKTITVQTDNDIPGKGITFRNTKRGWTSGKHYRLLIGQAENYSPREVTGY